MNEAYAVLGDPTAGAEYDKTRAGNRPGDYRQASQWDSKVPVDGQNSFEGWDFVLRYYPEAEKQRTRLAEISGSLGFAFQVVVLDRKDFGKLQKTADGLLAEYLGRYFGTSAQIHHFALSAIAAGRKDVALELNRAINALGSPSDVNAGNLISGICKHCGFQQHVELEKPVDGGTLVLVIVIILVVVGVLLALGR